MAPLPLLRQHSDVTPEWLTDVLARAGQLAEGASVRSFEAAPIGTGQMADTTRFTLTLDHAGAGPSSVVGKFASADDQSRGTGLALRAYEIEVRFYREVAARVGARLPAVYLAEVEPETGWFTLLMEDIAGATQGDQIAACGPDVGDGRARGDGRPPRAVLGGARAGAPRVAQPVRPPSPTASSSRWCPRCCPGFLERYADTLAPEHQAVCRLFVEHLPDYLRLRGGPRTASHGDFRLDNLLFQPGTPRPVVVDWQTVAWAGASIDVAYFIGGCLSAEDRRAHEPELLAHYHDALCRRGVRDYSLQQLRADARRDTFAGLLMAIVASMVVQRTERGDLMFLTSSTRHAQHALDVDAPALLLAAT